MTGLGGAAPLKPVGLAGRKEGGGGRGLSALSTVKVEATEETAGEDGRGGEGREGGEGERRIRLRSGSVEDGLVERRGAKG